MLKLIPFPEVFPFCMELRISASYPTRIMNPFPMEHMQPMDIGSPMLRLADVSMPNEIMGPLNASLSQNWAEAAALKMSGDTDGNSVFSIMRSSLCSDKEPMPFSSGNFNEVSAHTDQ